MARTKPKLVNARPEPTKCRRTMRRCYGLYPPGWFGVKRGVPCGAQCASPLQRVDKLLGKMEMLLKRIRHLKSLRRGVYRSVDGLKKSWFGWLANRKVQLARKYRAVMREHMTVVAKEKEAQGYFGRTFNKMINNGAGGQYLRTASSKLNGMGSRRAQMPPHIASPSLRPQRAAAACRVPSGAWRRSPGARAPRTARCSVAG